jgi:hypothetical protein
MKRVLLFVCMSSLFISLMAQDFTLLYMRAHPKDNNLNCVTVSPRMMQKVMNLNVNDAEMVKMISDLKSMRMVTAKTHVKKYYDEAIFLAKENITRYLPYASYQHKKQDYEIMIRKRRKVIVELVMLMKEEDGFTVIDFTGNMNQNFIDKLTTPMTTDSQ